MTLDELIEALQELQRRWASAGTAVVVGVHEPRISGGMVFLIDRVDDDDEELVY